MRDICILSVINLSSLQESFMHNLHWQTYIYLWCKCLSALQTSASRFKSMHYDKWLISSLYRQLLIILIYEMISLNDKSLCSLFRARHFFYFNVLSDDGKESLKKWNNDVVLNKLYISIADEMSLLIIIYKKYIFDINHQIQSLMKGFFRKNWRFQKCLTETKERIVEIIQLFNTTTLQQMSEKEKEKKNEKMINVDEKSAKNVKMKKN